MHQSRFFDSVCSLRLTSTIAVALLFLAACGDEQATVPDVDTTTAAADTAMTAPPDTAAQKINLNTATEADFRTIPNVGDRMVGEFMEYRPYVSIQQFREEIGKYVDEEQVASYEQYVFVPIDPNESDEATLQQLPGVDASIAGQLAAGRPYDSDNAFLDALSGHVTPQQLAQAEIYLVQE